MTNSRQDVRLATWNANGIIQYREELQVFLDTHNIDICLISETHFDNQSFIKFKEYRVYSSKHP